MKSFLRHLSLLDIIHVLFCLALVVLHFSHILTSRYKISALLYYALIFGFIGAMVRYREKGERNRLHSVMMLIYPMITMFLLFGSLSFSTNFFNPKPYDQAMAALDLKWFGTYPTVWMSQWITPARTEIMYILYLFYFPMPVIPLVWLFLKKDYRGLEEMLFTFFLCYYGAFIMYFNVPVLGPRYFLKELHSVPLNGYFLTDPIRNLINFMEPTKQDCFPSMHTAITFMAVFVSYYVNRKLFVWFSILSLGILLSLIYCRYHYVVDILAGAVWACICYFIGKRIFAKAHPYFSYQFVREI